MTEIEWQLVVANIAIRPGAGLEIQDRWQCGGTVFCRVTESGASKPAVTESGASKSVGTESGAQNREATNGSSAVSAIFIVRCNVCIGGKNYLLLQSPSNSATESGDTRHRPYEPDHRTYVVRLLDKDRLTAMDPDRYSSLRNALCSFLETNVQTHPEELEKLLGALHVVPPDVE